METDERNLMNELLLVRKEINRRMTYFMNLAFILFVVMLFSFFISICVIENIHAKADIEQTRLYFETDYSYGTMNVGGDIN